MRRRAQFLLFAAVLLAAAIVYDAHVAANVLASRAAGAERARRYAEAMRQIRLREGQALRAGGSSRGARNPNAARPVAKAEGASGAALTPRLLIASDAALLRKYMDNYRDGIDVEYGLFVQMLGLSPADAAQFKQLMAAIEAVKLHVAQTAASDGLDPSDPQMKALQSQLNHQNWLDLNQLLGPAGMVALKQYGSEWPVVTLVQNFGGNLPDPTLTIDQAQRLIPILSAASEHDGKGVVIPDTINVQQALTGAAPVLNGDQMLILSAMLQESEAKAKISQLSQGTGG